MRTFTTLYSKVFSGFIMMMLFTPTFNAQSLSASGSNAYAESKKLSAESDRFAEQAAQLRENARYTNGSGHDMLIEEAEALEKLSMDKNALSQKLEYDEHATEYVENEKKLAGLEKNKQGNKNAMQIKFLSTNNVKNRKTANDLYQEAVLQKALALKIGSYQNANEKILEAIRQQKDLLRLLKTGNTVK